MKTYQTFGKTGQGRHRGRRQALLLHLSYVLELLHPLPALCLNAPDASVAGFECGTGFYINPVPPEQAAGFLGEIEVDVSGGRKS